MGEKSHIGETQITLSLPKFNVQRAWIENGLLEKFDQALIKAGYSKGKGKPYRSKYMKEQFEKLRQLDNLSDTLKEAGYRDFADFVRDMARHLVVYINDSQNN